VDLRTRELTILNNKVFENYIPDRQVPGKQFPKSSKKWVSYYKKDSRENNSI
jgi:hypothetical protein